MPQFDKKDYSLITVNEDTGQKVYFDTQSHRIFEISDFLYDVIEGEEEWPDAVKREWMLLIEKGVLGAYNSVALSDSDPLGGANLALNINLTSFCNLGCSYCFADGGDYGRITGKLSKDVDVDAIVAFIQNNAAREETVRLEFFGGEPLMNFDVIEELCARSVKLQREQGISFVYRVSTNLTTRMSEKVLSLFERFKFIVSVSIDGGEETHDKNRPRKTGHGSYEAIIKNCQMVRDQSDDITMVARMTYVPREDSTLIGDVLPLYDTNIFDWFQIYPVTVSEEVAEAVFGQNLQSKEVYSEKIKSEFASLHGQYLSLFSEKNRFKGLLETETIIRMILTGEYANGFCSGGRNYYTFSPDKSIMPCHRLVGEKEFQVGDFSSGVNEENLLEWRKTVDTVPKCSDCFARYICGGGCKQENYIASQDINIPDPEKCEFQFLLLKSAIKIIANADRSFLERQREVLNDLFVSCGRPILPNKRRGDVKDLPEMEHFRLLF